MIIGNPYQLSFFVEVIEEWNQKGDIPSFRNGVFLLCLNGELFPKQVNTATLNVDIPDLKNSLLNIPIDEEVFSMEKQAAFIKMYNLTFPHEGGCDFSCQFYISPPALYDYECYAFAVKNKSHVRIMAAKLNYIIEESDSDFNNIDVTETIITHAELNEFISELDKIINPTSA